MSNRKLRFGLVGAGAIAQTYAQVFEKWQQAELVAVADIRGEAAKVLAERWKCQSHSSHEDMVQKNKLDAAIVCTPPSTHPEICQYFFEKGIHVLCEKPLSIEVRTAKAMVEAAKKAGVKFTMASKFRYVDDVIRAKSIVTSGILGEIVLFENAFTSRVNMAGRWNSVPEVGGGGVLIDNGTHSLDLMRYFLGPLAEIQVVEGKRIQGLPVEDTVRIFVRSEMGVMGSIDLSWSINKELDSYINIYGSRGTVFVGWKESKYRQSSSPEWVVFGKGYDKNQAFRSQINNFAKAIQGEEALLITPEEALESVEAIEAAYGALKESKWTSINGRGKDSRTGKGEKKLSLEGIAS